MLDLNPLIALAATAVAVSVSGAGAQPTADRIAYERGTARYKTDIYVMDADGTNPRRVASGCCHEWSPNGRMIAFARGDGIYVIKADGTKLRLLVTPGVQLCCELDWSRDDSRIAFTGWSGGIGVVSADGKNRTQLTRDEDASPRWSPDGRKLLFTRHVRGSVGNDVFVMNADGSHVRRLTRDYGLNAAEGSSWSPWSPDSRRVVVGGPNDIVVLSVDGSGESNLTQSSGFLDDDPSWSPRGTRIVFTSTPRFRRTRTIHTITPDGRRHRSLAQGSQPSWSADGRSIVFIRAQGDKSDIFVMAASGRNRALLTNTQAPEFEPAFAPK